MAAAVRGTPLPMLAVLAGAALGGCAAPPGAEGTSDADLGASLDAALGYLLGLRDGEGAWDPALVPLVAEAAAAAGLDADAWPAPLPLRGQLAWPAEDGTLLSALRPLHAQALHGDEAGRARVRDRVLAGFRDGQFGDPALLNDDAFALLALAAAGAARAPEAAAAAEALARNQTAEGGWGWAVGGQARTDLTGMVLVALADTQQAGLADSRAAGAYLAAARSAGGGFGAGPGEAPNCDSTVWALRGLGVLGAPADGPSWRYLLGLQDGKAGGFAYVEEGQPNALCTAEAATLLALGARGDVEGQGGPG